MATNYFKIKKGANFENLASAVSAKGDVAYNSATDKLELYNGAVDPFVQEAKAATLTNKTLTSPTINGGTTDSATFTNASIITNSLFKDVVDNTKTFQISSSANTTGKKMTLASAATVDRILTLPDATDTLVARTTTDTLTNKTLSGNTATNLVSGSGTITFNTTGTITVPNATDTLVGKATTDTLTNKTLSGNTATNLVSGSGTFTFNTTGTVTVPNGTDTLVARTSTDTLTNKTIGDALTFTQVATPSSPASGFNKFYPKSNNLFYTLDSTGAERQVGSGTGSINYILNPDAEGGTTGWATYADAAGSQPVDGTGGSPTETYTRTTSSPLRGTGSFLLTKDAANRQGEGASYNFTIDSADQGKSLYISFDYAIASGTYATGDLAMYVYDVTNSLVLQSIPFQISGATANVPQRFIGYVQASSNSTSYRLIIHTATTSASAYTVKFDNFITGPSAAFYGAVVTDEIDDSNNIIPNNFGTVTNKSIWTKRVGDKLHVRGVFTCGTVTASTASITLTGYTIDSTKFSSATNTQMVGFGEQLQTGGATFFSSLTFGIFYDGSDTAKVYMGNDIASRQITKDTGNGIANSSDVLTFEFSVPIVGWSSNVNMSSSTRTTPTQQRFTSGSGTYTTPNGVKYLKVRMVGGGGGGSGSGTSGGPGSAGTAGGNTTFGSSLLTANGGGASGAGSGSVGGTGGSTTITSPAFGTGLDGGNGGGSSEFAAADNHGSYHGTGHGGISFFGGAGAIPAANQAGLVGKTNTGSGGSGGNKQATGSVVTDSGTGGGAGGYIEAYIPGPSATYSYAVGAAGSSGGAGTSGLAGAAGGSGYIEVTEYYANEGSIGLSPMGYFSGYFTDSSQWTTTSGSFVDGTNSGGNALTTVYTSNLGAVTAGASTVCGVSFAPSSNSATYEVTFMGDMDNTGTSGDGILRIFDGTTMVGAQRFRSAGASGGRFPVTVSGIWKPGTTASSTIKLQFAATVGTFETIANSTAGVCVWVTIKQLTV